MYYSRRDFLKLTGSLAASLAIAPQACAVAGSSSLGQFGLQLYTLRDDMPKDPAAVLRQVAGFGYKQVESYEHDKLGMFWGMGHTGFKKYMDDLGMTLVASHCDISKDFEQKAAQAAAIGMQYLVCPWKGPQKTIDDFRKIADDFNSKGEICKKNGIRFAYHNHDYSFKILEGQVPQQVLMDHTDPALVDFEMDIYWVVAAGEDPESWLKKYRSRFRLCHIKDRSKGTNGEKASCVLGTGSINFPKILSTARNQGMHFYIVEQEKYEGTTPLQATAANAAYMKKLKLS